MTGDWLQATWGDVVTLQRGFDITKAQQVLEGDVPVVSSGGISSFHNVAAQEGPGVVMGRKGTLGRVFYLDGPYWPHDTTLWVKDFKGNSPRFVYYALLGIDTKSFDVGSSNPTLNRNHVHPLPVRWPSTLAEQERIAGVLGAFDDLIETNRRLIDRMDQLAVARADDLASRASTSPRTFADVAAIGGGSTPSTRVAEFWGGEHPWTTPKDITALPSRFLFDTPRKLTDAGLAKCSSPLRPVGSILMTSRATVGEFALAEVPVAVNQGFIVVNGDVPEDTTWLYFEMRRRVPEFQTIASKGSTFPEISRREFKTLQLRWPGEADRERLHREVAPLVAASAHLEGEVAELTRQRDELLPLLMSGRVRVRDLEAVA